MSNALDQGFYERACCALRMIAESLEEQAGQDIDLDEESERITVVYRDKIYLVNIHETAQQIWVASPVSGAHHFAYSPEKGWCSTKDLSLSLKDLISSEFSLLLGRAIHGPHFFSF